MTTPQYQVGRSANGRLTLDGQEMGIGDPRMYGQSGQQFVSHDLGGRQIIGDGGQFTRRTAEGVRDESGNRSLDQYELAPEIAELLQGNVQLGQATGGDGGSEGWGEYQDINQVKYDPRVGYYTPGSNIKGEDPTKQRQSQTTYALITAGLAAPAAVHALGAAAGSGSAGVGAGAEGTATLGGGGSLGGGALGGGGGGGLSLAAGGEAGIGAGNIGTAVSGSTAGAAGISGAASGAGATGANVMSGIDWSQILGIAGDAYNAFGPNSPSHAARDDRQFNERMWAEALRANRPNISTPFMNQQWSRDEQGNWNLNQQLNKDDQSRLDQFRGIAGDRMRAASQVQTPNWSAINPRVAQMIGALNLPSLGGGAVGKKPSEGG